MSNEGRDGIHFAGGMSSSRSIWSRSLSSSIYSMGFQRTIKLIGVRVSLIAVSTVELPSEAGEAPSSVEIS
jgi:hypothetical protein